MQLLLWTARVTAFGMIGFVVNGFSPVAKLEHGSRGSSILNQVSTDYVEHRNAAMTFLISTTAALMIMASQPIPAMASTWSPIDFLPTVQVSEQIKELDFSLPKYDEIKSYKASAENVESLTIKITPVKPGSLGLSTASSSGVIPSGSSDDGSNPVNSVMSSLLPSLSKKGPAAP